MFLFALTGTWASRFWHGISADATRKQRQFTQLVSSFVLHKRPADSRRRKCLQHIEKRALIARASSATQVRACARSGVVPVPVPRPGGGRLSARGRENDCMLRAMPACTAGGCMQAAAAATATAAVWRRRVCARRVCARKSRRRGAAAPRIAAFGAQTFIQPRRRSWRARRAPALRLDRR